MIPQNTVEKLKHDADWLALQQHIQSELRTLETTEGIDWTDKEKAAIEGLARSLASEKLRKILDPFMFQEAAPTDDAQRLKREKLGL